ncbi:DUF1707 and DUF4190 domain-containing protein [Kitasatospora sp. NPDC096128]|uniref:DUF1707 and DUF4190 domain-containing protein n=1 Tax=Kitasatospora sp. NPDC096128 TaxID=3155547 RepID=UPI003325DECD
MSVQGWGDQDPQRQPAWAPAPQPVGQVGMRAGHADRDRTIDVLKAAFAEGRLSAQEYEQRHEAAAAAQTYGQLATLVADLPVGPMPVAPLVQAPQPAQPAQPVPATFLPMPPPRPGPTSGLAVASFVLSLVGASPVAVVTGHIARSQIRRRNLEGDWAAVAGLVIGYLGLAFWVLMVLLGAVMVSSGGPGVPPPPVP